MGWLAVKHVFIDDIEIFIGADTGKLCDAIGFGVDAKSFVVVPVKGFHLSILTNKKTRHSPGS